MSLANRALLVLASSAGLLGSACSSAPPPVSAPTRVVAPPAATEIILPPPADVSICQRNAKPTTGADATTTASFEQFSSDWIAKMKAVASARFATDRKRLRNTYEMEVRSTGSAEAPWVGLLSYCEITMQCESPGESSCKPASSTVVMEMFRYQAGQWVY